VRADELLLGASTLREATWHQVPGLKAGSTSHTTVGFAAVIREGLEPLRRRLAARLAEPDLDPAGRDFISAAQECLEALALWHRRNLAELERLRNAAQGDARQRLDGVLTAARHAPEQPARDFREALQALWTQWEFLRLCGDWSGIGRVDRILGPYLEADLASGAIDRDTARELLAHFWIKGCGWIGANPVGSGGSGDAQFYQNVILGGIAPDGTPVENTVTDLVLDVVDELHISDFPIAVRVSARTPELLWRRIAEVQRRGGGIVSIYNEDLVIRALTGFGLPLVDARDFTNDGCWEVLVPGRSAFTYAPFDALHLLQDAIGLGESPVPAADDFATLYAHVAARLRAHVDLVHAECDRAFTSGQSAPLLSLFVDGCIERARGYHSGGAHYQFRAPHAGGLPDVANSLLAIRHLVFTAKRLTLAQLVEVLRADWVGHEALRAEVQREVPLYGNGDAEADAMLRRVFDDYTAAVALVRERNRVHRPAGISTFGRELSFREHRHATAFGARRGAILSSNLAPTPGSERNGPTAVIASYCAMDFSRLPNGTPLDLKLFPGDLAGEDGLNVLTAMQRAFVALGGWYLQVDVVDRAVLRDAQEHPERHANLAVRISGWSARFTTLDRDWQQLVIDRCEHRVR
jgi:formate C-acetyltransferase